jgi:hypothetical protein
MMAATGPIRRRLPRRLNQIPASDAFCDTEIRPSCTRTKMMLQEKKKCQPRPEIFLNWRIKQRPMHGCPSTPPKNRPQRRLVSGQGTFNCPEEQCGAGTAKIYLSIQL